MPVGGIERFGQSLFLVEIAGAVPELRPADAGRPVVAENPAGGILALDVEDEDVLGGDDVALGADHFGDVGDAPGTVAETRNQPTVRSPSRRLV